MKNILLIGGSYGIGSSLSKILADKNNVIVASRTEPEFKHNNIKYIKFDAKTDLLDVNELPTSIDGFVYLPGSMRIMPQYLNKKLSPNKLFQICNIKAL